MRRQRGLVGLMGLAALVGLGLQANSASAAITTEQSASILVFPKVIANGTRDTIIQITNTSNAMRHAHCFYINGALQDPRLPVGPFNQPLCTEVNFDIWLTRQQPTHWVVSTGRLVNQEASTCRTVDCVSATSGTIDANCCDSGIDPNRIPPVVPDFFGELKCIEVDESGAPEPGNALKGEATIIEPANSNDVEKYNAIGIKGFDNNDANTTLCLGGGVTDPCPQGAEYEACPAGWLLDHPLTDSVDPVIEESSTCTAPPCSSVASTLVVVPCTEALETQAPGDITLQFVVTDEFEQSLSVSTAFSCFAAFNLGSTATPTTFPADIRSIGSLFNTAGHGGASLALTRMRATSLSDPSHPAVGVLAVIEETHTNKSNGTTASAAQNGHTTFEDQPNGDVLVFPADQGAIPPDQGQ